MKRILTIFLTSIFTLYFVTILNDISSYYLSRFLVLNEASNIKYEYEKSGILKEDTINRLNKENIYIIKDKEASSIGDEINITIYKKINPINKYLFDITVKESILAIIGIFNS